MDAVMFTKDELNDLTISQMKILVEYHHLEVHGRLKADYIQALSDFYYKPKPVQEDLTNKMSVRIRRIKEASNG